MAKTKKTTAKTKGVVAPKKHIAGSIKPTTGTDTAAVKETEVKPPFETQYPIPDEIRDRLKDIFMSHLVTDDQAKRMNNMRGIMHLVAETIVSTTPVCREQSIALIKVEEAMYFANEAICRNETPSAKLDTPVAEAEAPHNAT